MGSGRGLEALGGPDRLDAALRAALLELLSSLEPEERLAPPPFLAVVPPAAFAAFSARYSPAHSPRCSLASWTDARSCEVCAPSSRLDVGGLLVRFRLEEMGDPRLRVLTSGLALEVFLSDLPDPLHEVYACLRRDGMGPEARAAALALAA